MRLWYISHIRSLFLKNMHALWSNGAGYPVPSTCMGAPGIHSGREIFSIIYPKSDWIQSMGEKFQKILLTFRQSCLPFADTRDKITLKEFGWVLYFLIKFQPELSLWAAVFLRDYSKYSKILNTTVVAWQKGLDKQCRPRQKALTQCRPRQKGLDKQCRPRQKAETNSADPGKKPLTQCRPRQKDPDRADHDQTASEETVW